MCNEPSTLSSLIAFTLITMILYGVYKIAMKMIS